MTNDELEEEQPPVFERLPEDLEEALIHARKATEELPPLEELAALQEAMAGLAQIGAVMGRMRAASQRDEESVENPGEDPDPQPLG